METTQRTSIKDLTAPEAYILLHGSPSKLGNGGQAFKLAILELVGRGWLGVREPPETLRSQSDVRLLRGKRTDAPEDRTLFAAYRLVDDCFSAGWAPDDGLPGFALWKGFGERYSGSAGYAQMEVLPSLRARGMYERAGSGLLGVLLRGGWRRTETGDQVQARLRDTLSEAEESFSSWVREDTRKALEFIGHSGVAVLLLPSLYTEIARLPDGGVDGTSSSSEKIEPQVFNLLAALSGVLDGASRYYSDGWGGGGTGFGGFGGLGFGGDGGGGASGC